MAKEYFEKLSTLVDILELNEEIDSLLEVKHFFSGAALYCDSQICASWSPAGLAFKLPDEETERLIASGEAMPLRYFATGHIKNGYALFENPTDRDASGWREYFVKAVRTASGG